MQIKLSTLWTQLRGSFWFLPTLMSIGAFLLGIGMLWIDQTGWIDPSSNSAWFYSGSPDGVRSLLSTIAGSMISVAGVTFSITIATLSLASSQLGPRLLQNFMNDRGNQVALGTFVSVFVYCVVILRSIRSGEDFTFVPHLSVIVAMLLTAFSLGVLIYFFHHVSIIIQAQNVIAEIGEDLQASIDRLIEPNAGQQKYEKNLRNEDDIPSDYDENAVKLTGHKSGYLQTIDYESMLEIATENDLVMKTLFRPGDFIAETSDVITFYPSKALDEELEEKIRSAFTLGAQRLQIQDVEFAIDQLVEVAARALSPGINDPFTAISCLDQIATRLSNLASRKIPTGYYYDEEDNLRIVSETVTFSGLVNSAFDKIRQYARTDVAVTMRMLESLAIIMTRTSTDTQREALIRQADMIKRAVEAKIFEENDREEILSRYYMVVRAESPQEHITD